MSNQLPRDGKLFLYRAYYSAAEAQQFFDSLLAKLAWQQEKIFLYGRWLNVPRLMCWYGDDGAEYKYSGVNHQPLIWTKTLLKIKQDIESEFNYKFNSVMANLYRDGSDSMGCHADDEKELGHNPVIASLSLGEERLIKFRHIQTKQVIDILLGHGDLLLMTDQTQQHWRHELPKTKKVKAARINLTFRKIII